MRHYLHRYWAIAVIACLACQQISTAQDAESKKDATYEVKSERLVIKLTLDGNFDAENSHEVLLRPKAWSKLEVVAAVPHGTAVPKGTQLIEFALEDLERAIVSAEYDVQLAQLGLRSAIVSSEVLKKTAPMDREAAERGANEATADLAYFLEVSKPQSERGVEESLKRSKHSLEYVQEELDQLRKMYEADDLTEETEEIILKRASRAVESAEYSLESAEIRAERTLKTDLPRQEQSQRENTERQVTGVAKTLVTLEASVRQTEIELEKKRIELEQAEKKLVELREDLEILSSVVSPIDGYIYYGLLRSGSWSGKDKSDNYLVPGGNVPAKTVVMTVVPESVTHLHATVKESDRFALDRGMAATVTATASPDVELDAALELLGRVPVSAGSFECVFRLAGTARNIVPGMSGKAEVTTYNRADAVLVPSKAVFDDGGEKVVYLAEDRTRRVVETGRKKDDKVEISKGLNEGDKILLERPSED